jgi:hypothetical protein
MSSKSFHLLGFFYHQIRKVCQFYLNVGVWLCLNW